MKIFFNRSEGKFGADTLRRRRRQAVSSTEVDTREVYSVVMAELSRYNDTISGIGIIITISV